MKRIEHRILVLLIAAASLAALPRAEAGAAITRIAFGSCASLDKPQPVWRAILALRPAAFVSLGDIVYVNRGDEDHAARVAAYQKLSAIPEFRKLRQRAIFLATWDDGELGTNDGGADFPRLEEFRRDFLDFTGEPADSEVRRSGGTYTAQTFGPPGRRVQIILLDTRSFRSPLRRGDFPEDEGRYLPDASPEKTMLGAAQWKWLEEQLRRPAELRLVGSSIQVVPEEQKWEKWANFPHERQRLFEVVRRTAARGVIFLSGDRHLAELSATASGTPYPFFDLTSSGLNVANLRTVPHEPNRYRANQVNWSDNFGLVEVNWSSADPLLSLQIRDAAGDILFQRKLRLSLLQPKP
jgi:alkaline phosphatase D